MKQKQDKIKMKRNRNEKKSSQFETDEGNTLKKKLTIIPAVDGESNARMKQITRRIRDFLILKRTEDEK